MDLGCNSTLQHLLSDSDLNVQDRAQLALQHFDNHDKMDMDADNVDVPSTYPNNEMSNTSPGVDL